MIQFNIKPHDTARTSTTPSSNTTCSEKLNTHPWNQQSQPGYGPGASEADPLLHIPASQPLLPQQYRKASAQDLAERIAAARRALGERVLILGHYYQRDDIVAHADFIGDSFQLAQIIAQKPHAETIVFCGVHFMAETARILAREHQSIVLPHLGAGCSMADMASSPAVMACWDYLHSVYHRSSQHTSQRPAVIPITYMNSSAALKAFCGDHGGIVCTSSNAQHVLEWALSQGQRVLFFPDQHLGRNTAHALKIPPEQIVLWERHNRHGGLSEQQIVNAKVILWNGFCSVHQRFSVAQVHAARARFSEAIVLAHPECSQEVVQAADVVGSTDVIARTVKQAAPGQVFAIGTEINMVNRLAQQYPQHTIFCLDPVVCPCSTMYRIHPAYLAWVLDGLMTNQIHNAINVPTAIAKNAYIALQRMLEVKP